MSEGSEAIPWLTVELWQALVDQRLLPDSRVELLEGVLYTGAHRLRIWPEQAAAIREVVRELHPDPAARWVESFMAVMDEEGLPLNSAMERLEVLAAEIRRERGSNR
ncbi:MAG: hypothetical protein ACR2RL_06400 [Gammaproteobacteria bacterium]